MSAPPTPKKASPVVGIIVAVIIVGAVGTVGYYQAVIAPGLLSVTTTPHISCTPSTCVNVTLTQDAATCEPSPCGYDPTSVSVVVGHNATVFWKNADTAAHHTVTFSGIGSPDMGTGAVYSRVFDVAGTYNYVCSYHPFMKGTVTVKP